MYIDLESSHNVRLKCMPKNIHLKCNGMYLHSIIAILDHNYNVNKTMEGGKLVISKPNGCYTLRIVKRLHQLIVNKLLFKI